MPPSLNFPQLDFVEPSSGFHPVTWERVNKVLTQHMVWRIWCVDGGEQWQIGVYGRTSTDGRGRTDGTRQTNGRWRSLDETITKVGQNKDKHHMERRNEMAKRNRLRLRQTALMMVLQNGLCPQALQWWHAKKKKKKFFSYFVFFYKNFLLLFLILELLQGLLNTWLQAQKHTRVHNPNVNLKTHVEGK